MSTCKQLQQQFPSVPPHEVELLCAHVLGCSREHVIAYPELVTGRLSTQGGSAWGGKDWKIKRLLKRREQGVPLAYLTGHKEFFGLDFIVDKHVLIPRPDTEVLVSLVLDEIERLKDYKIVLIDVGTGSGCIPIAITSVLKHFSTQAPTVYATDISRHALHVAKQNAQKHNVDITFLHGDLLSPISNFKFQISNLIITANLPYLTEQQYKDEPSIQHEPKQALVANNNGLALYEELLTQIAQIVTGYGLRVMGFFEIDPSQKQQISNLIQTYLPNSDVHIHKDLAGHDRVAEIECTKR